MGTSFSYGRPEGWHCWKFQKVLGSIGQGLALIGRHLPIGISTGAWDHGGAILGATVLISWGVSTHAVSGVWLCHYVFDLGVNILHIFNKYFSVLLSQDMLYVHTICKYFSPFITIIPFKSKHVCIYYIKTNS